MYFKSVNIYGACSTVLMYDYHDDPSETVETFKKKFLKRLQNGIEIDSVSGRDFPFEKHAFLIISEVTDYDGWPYIDIFRELEFDETEPEYNSKNETHVILFTIPIRKLLKNIGWKSNPNQDYYDRQARGEARRKADW